MLNNMFHRTCLAYTEAHDLLATCQGGIDLLFLFAAALTAGLVILDERVGLVGFIPAHLIGTIVFLAVLQIPVSGLGDPFLSDAVLSRSLVLALRYQFPYQPILSLVGCAIGVFFRDRLGFAEVFHRIDD